MAGFENQVMVAKNVNFDHLSNPPHNGIVTADGQLLIGSTANPNIAMVANTLTPGAGISITNAPGSITIANTGSLTDLHTAKWIVNNVANSGGNQTTIQGAINVASAGDTIFVMPGATGVYTENLNLKAGVNIVAFTGDGDTPNVTIVGKMTATFAGTATISNIRLQTSSDNILAMSGSNATIINLINCYINATNNTAISNSVSNASSGLNIISCRGNLGTTGIAYFSDSSTGSLAVRNCNLSNSGASTTANTKSAGLLNVFGCILSNPITHSSSSTVSGIAQSAFGLAAINATALTTSGTGSVGFSNNFVNSGTASAISIGAGTIVTVSSSNLFSSNANVVTGAGTFIDAGTFYSGTSAANNVTTKTQRFFPETRSAVALASAITLTNVTPANVTSISLAAGTWDITGVVQFNGNVTGTASGASINTVSATLGTQGDNYVTTPTVSTTIDLGVVVPTWRQTFTATTTVYLIALAAFTGGTQKAYGRISAVRIA